MKITYFIFILGWLRQMVPPAYSVFLGVGCSRICEGVHCRLWCTPDGGCLDCHFLCTIQICSSWNTKAPVYSKPMGPKSNNSLDNCSGQKLFVYDASFCNITMEKRNNVSTAVTVYCVLLFVSLSILCIA